MFGASSWVRHAHTMQMTTAVVAQLSISKPPALLGRAVVLLLLVANKLSAILWELWRSGFHPDALMDQTASPSFLICPSFPGDCRRP